MSSTLFEPSVAGTLPSRFFLVVAVYLSGCTAPTPADWPLLSESREVSSAFGPRLKASESARYDFHRGIDLPTPIGTPLVALEDGVVRIAGDHPSYADATIQVAHGHGCSGQPENCWYAGYIHVSEWIVEPGDTVRTGQILGYSGASDSGFEHLHFEVRDGTVWQQGAVNPVPWLDLADVGVPKIDAVVTASAIVVDLRVASRDLDLSGLVAEVIDSDGKVVSSHEYDPAAWNRAFTHTEPEWPAPRCEHSYAHPEGSPYDPHIHLDRPDFNGVFLQPAPFSADTPEWALTATFRATVTEGQQARVRAWDASGGQAITLAR